MKRKILLKSEKDTEKLAESLAYVLKSGDIIALYGDIGTGKTFFTQKLCFFLGVKEYVSSPSYVILNEYSGKYPIFHLDLYRLESEEELQEIGIFDLLEDGIVIIEWAEIAEHLLPEKTIKIKFNYCNDNNFREITIISENEILLDL